MILLFDILLIAAAVSDIRYHKIPDILIAMVLILGLAPLLGGTVPQFLALGIQSSVPLFPEKVAGFFLLPLLPLFCDIVRSGAFGGGDIKLLAACGFVLGWKLAFTGLVISILCCGIFCFVGMILKKLKRGSYVAFGPYICLGMMIAGIWGENMINWYTN